MAFRRQCGGLAVLRKSGRESPPTSKLAAYTETICELWRKIAAQGLTGPITLVLDNACDQRNAVVIGLAVPRRIT